MAGKFVDSEEMGIGKVEVWVLGNQIQALKKNICIFRVEMLVLKMVGK